MIFHASLLIGALAPIHVAATIQEAGHEPPSARQELLLLRVAGLRELLVDAKDRPLRDALALIGPRLHELPAELGQGDELPEALFALLGRLGTRPFDLRAGLTPEAPVPFHAQFGLHAGSERAAQMARAELERTLSAFGIEVAPADARGMHALPTPFPAWFGAREGELVISAGRRIGEPLEIDARHLPAGVVPALALQLDIGAALSALASMDLDVQELEPMLALYDRLGLARARVRFLFGHDDQAAYAMTSVEGVVAGMRANGLLPDEPLSQRSLALIPADALWAFVGGGNLQGGLRMLREWSELADGFGGISLQSPLAELEAALGIELERDLFAHLGPSLGLYASDTTGGGGLASMILFAEVADPRALSASLTRLGGQLNSALAEAARGYAQIRVHMLSGQRFSILHFPGLPIPLQPTWTISEGFFVLGWSTGAVQAALGHLPREGSEQGEQREQGRLIDTPRFRQQLPDGVEGLNGVDNLYGLVFIDSARLLRDGYGWSSLFCSALANALRSREELAREPGVLLPPFHELARGSKAFVRTTRVVGDDLVELARMDRSFLVNATALAGFVDTSPFLMALPGMVLLGTTQAVRGRMLFPAIESAPSGQQHIREELREDLLALHYACVEYALVNDGRYPEDLFVLIEPDASGARYLDRSSLPDDPWGRSYGYAPPSEGSAVPRIYSLGADGAPGGSGLDADMDNLLLLEEMRSGR